MSFHYGAASAVGAMIAFKVWEFFQYPSVKSIQGNCTQPLKTIGDEDSQDKVTVWGFEEVGTHEHWNLGISDDSPHVSRVEAYLRLIQQPYVKKESQGLMENPRGKVPFANIKGQMVDDSSAIIAMLQNVFEVKVDANLSDEDLTKGCMIRQVLFGSLYWVLLHQKFETDFGRNTFIQHVAAKFPPVIRNLICALVFRNMHATDTPILSKRVKPTCVACRTCWARKSSLWATRTRAMIPMCTVGWSCSLTTRRKRPIHG